MLILVVGIACPGRPQGLDGDDPINADLAGLEHRAHGPVMNATQNLVSWNVEFIEAPRGRQILPT
jgi:hypothetical protein